MAHLSLFRIILEVNNLKKAISFYTRLLGIKGKAVAGSRYYINCSGVILVLLQPQTKAKKIPQSIFFSVPDLEKVFITAKKLRCLSKINIHGSPAGKIITRPWGERSFYIVDADKNGICFIDEDTLFTG